nr:MAG TPA: hypothetical protein [Bacteriophage sp.]
MKYNTCMEFDLQDYHFLKSTTDSIQTKLDKVEDEVTSMLPEKSTGNSIVFEKNVPMIVDVICDCEVEGVPSFGTSVGMTIRRVTTDHPSYINAISYMKIVWTTSEENGSRGQIQWNTGYYDITTTGTETQWTLTLPEGYSYKITKNYF